MEMEAFLGFGEVVAGDDTPLRTGLEDIESFEEKDEKPSHVKRAVSGPIGS